MNEAKNLRPEPPQREPALFEATAVSNHPTEPLTQIPSGPATRLLVPHSFARQLFTQLLLFFLIGILTFALGAAVAVALVTGILDGYSGQFKDLLHQVKDLVGHTLGK
jgi:hypothetical protein